MKVYIHSRVSCPGKAALTHHPRHTLSVGTDCMAGAVLGAGVKGWT